MEIINKHIDRPTEFLVDELKKTDHIAKSYEIMEGLHNSFYSETIGVYQAFKLAKLLPDSEVKIILDNEAAQKIANKISHLKLQQLNKLEGRIIWNAIKKINDSLNTPPEVIWIKGHNGTPGNEYSDELAGKYKISQQTIKTYIPTSNADLPRNLRILNNKNHTFQQKTRKVIKGIQQVEKAILHESNKYQIKANRTAASDLPVENDIIHTDSFINGGFKITSPITNQSISDNRTFYAKINAGLLATNSIMSKRIPNKTPKCEQCDNNQVETNEHLWTCSENLKTIKLCTDTIKKLISETIIKKIPFVTKKERENIVYLVNMVPINSNENRKNFLTMMLLPIARSEEKFIHQIKQLNTIEIGYYMRGNLPTVIAELCQTIYAFIIKKIKVRQLDNLVDYFKLKVSKHFTTEIQKAIRIIWKQRNEVNSAKEIEQGITSKDKQPKAKKPNQEKEVQKQQIKPPPPKHKKRKKKRKVITKKQETKDTTPTIKGLDATDIHFLNVHNQNRDIFTSTIRYKPNSAYKLRPTDFTHQQYAIRENMRKVDPTLNKKKKYKNKKLVYNETDDTLVLQEKTVKEIIIKVPIIPSTTPIEIHRKRKEPIQDKPGKKDTMPNPPKRKEGRRRKTIEVPENSMGNNTIPMEMINQPTDSNCFYHAISAAITELTPQTKKTHDQIREEMIRYTAAIEDDTNHPLHEKFKEIRQEYPSFCDLITTRCSKIYDVAGWGGVIEAQYIANMYNIRIHIIMKNIAGNRETAFINTDCGPNHENNNIPRVYIYWENDHYQYLKPYKDRDDTSNTVRQVKKRKTEHSGLKRERTSTVLGNSPRKKPRRNISPLEEEPHDPP